MNAYWDVVKPYVVDGVIRPDGVDHFEAWADELRNRYSWTVTDPATVEFVREWCGEIAIDPFAGMGWWLSLLNADRFVAYGTDLHRMPDRWHVVDSPVDAAHVVSEARPAWARQEALLLAWPPRYDTAGERTIRAYQGPRIVHMGAQGRTCDGTDAMYQLLADEWVQIARHTPVRWAGVEDYVTVYERRG